MCSRIQCHQRYRAGITTPLLHWLCSPAADCERYLRPIGFEFSIRSTRDQSAQESLLMRALADFVLGCCASSIVSYRMVTRDLQSRGYEALSSCPPAIHLDSMLQPKTLIMKYITSKSPCPPRTLATLLIAFPFLPFCAGICYFPDQQTIAQQNFPCRGGSDDSPCCGTSYACVSNGLCMKSNDTFDVNSAEYVRGSCTDKTWRSAACPSFCIGPKGMLLCRLSSTIETARRRIE